MRRFLPLLPLLVIFTAVTVLAQAERPAPAKAVLAAAVRTAASSDRTVLLIFHASWCGWCKRLDTALADPGVKKAIEANYVVTHLDVQESKGKIDSLENPGGNEMLKDLGGEQSGIPYMVFFNGKGKKTADSNVMPKNMNIGYPGTAEEIDMFGKLLKKTSKHMTGEQFTLVIDYLKAHAPPPAKPAH